MSTEVPKVGALITLACFVVGGILFFALNSSFGGPTPVADLVTEDRYRLETRFDDAEGLLSKSLVLVNGVQVGEVESVEVGDEDALVTIALDERYAPVPEGTVARLGNRTVFGEKYVDLEVPGNDPLPAGEGSALAAGTELASEPIVPLDEALDVLNDRRRQRLVAVLQEVARGTSRPEAPEQINTTLGELAQLTAGVRRLTDELRGQEDEIAGLVDGSRAVLSALGDREQSLRRIVGAGRITLEAVASRQDSLAASLDELPGTLEVTRSTLAAARPLVAEARPLVRDLTAAAPHLRAAVNDLPPVSRDARRVVAGLRPLRAAAEPVVASALPALDALLPVARKLEPATANLVPVARFLSPRRRDATNFFTNLGASVSGPAGDEWLRTYILFNDDIAAGTRPPAECSPGSEPAAAGFCNNAYPEPGDAASNEPFDGYPRLRPFEAPPRR